jgi:hypothetical protein
LNEAPSARFKDGDYVDFEVALTEAHYYRDRIQELTHPIADAMGDIFGYYLSRNAGSFFAAARESIGDAVHMRGGGLLHTSDKSSDSYLEDMGLTCRDGLTLYRERGQSIPSYGPDDLASLDAVDASLIARSGSFQEEAGIDMFVGLRQDPLLFLEVHAFWRSFFELAAMATFAADAKASLFLPSTIEVRVDGTQPTNTADTIRLYRVFLQNAGLLPTPETFEDVLRLREDPNLRSLREVLAEWTATPDAERGDNLITGRIQKDVALASRSLRPLGALARVGRLIGYVSLPVAVAEFLTHGGAIGLALAPVGPAIDAYRFGRERRAGWVRFGRIGRS